MPMEPITMRGLRPNLSTSDMEITAKVKFTNPIRAVWNNAESEAKPADLKMEGA